VVLENVQAGKPYFYLIEKEAETGHKIGLS